MAMVVGSKERVCSCFVGGNRWRRFTPRCAPAVRPRPPSTVWPVPGAASQRPSQRCQRRWTAHSCISHPASLIDDWSEVERSTVGTTRTDFTLSACPAIQTAPILSLSVNSLLRHTCDENGTCSVISAALCQQTLSSMYI